MGDERLEDHIKLELYFYDDNGNLISDENENLAMEDYKDIKEKSKFRSIDRLIEMLEKVYGFDGPHHYTDLLNLKDIFKDNSLYSRSKVEKEHDFLDSANQRIINHTGDLVKDQVRFYYRGGTPTLWANEGIRPKDYEKAHMPIPVLLLFKKDLLYFDSLSFTYGGAGSSKSLLDLKISEIYSIDWIKVFSNKPEYRNERNSELWIKDMVSLDYVDRIIFRSQSEKQLAESLYKELENYTYLVDRDKFTNSASYLSELGYTKEMDRIELNLNFNRDNISYSDYHRLDVYYKIGVFEKLNFRLDESLVNKWIELESIYGSVSYKYRIYGKKLDIDIVIENPDKDMLGLEYFLNDCLCGKI